MSWLIATLVTLGIILLIITLGFIIVHFDLEDIFLSAIVLILILFLLFLFVRLTHLALYGR